MKGQELFIRIIRLDDYDRFKFGSCVYVAFYIIVSLFYISGQIRFGYRVM